MNIVRICRPALAGILAATCVALIALPMATAGELKIKLSGTTEVPPVSTTASGNAAITVNQNMTVNGTVMTSGIAATAAHIHLGKTGTNGPVIVTLARSSDNVWTVPDGTKLNEDEYRAYLAGELYLNVHSEQYKAGELRGQLMPGKKTMNGK